MHMADALVNPTVAGLMYGCSAIAAGYSIKKVRMENEPKKIPVMGVMGAFVFAAQMINFTVPGTGSSGHLCGGILLSAILGPFAGFITMIGVLAIQCLMFADGGILALGCNIWNIAFYGCFIGCLLIWKPIMKNGASKGKIILASIIGSILTLQIGAFSVAIETLGSGISDLPFLTFISVLQPIHLAIGLIEGLITAAVLCFIYEARPELLWSIDKSLNKKIGRISFRKVMIIFSLLTLLIAGGVSLVASEYPDGLEWSIEKITNSTEIEVSGEVYDSFEKVQETTSVLPDYNFKDSDLAIGTSLSGIIGGVVVAFICIGGCYLFKFFRKETIN
ncbi:MULTISPECIES: energy-coupling factor ABC transporter permease [Clostridium]|jgi:cobalt/nickel transport system permease protein|uniref:energy-coupling factor ABC transporter permease n=2 Tax=Clostridiaceae TaxID=31979 RepID=UPI00019B031B|nr:MULTISPECIES: energy-coupling factor ABC transporter permease [Clostridium]EEH97943.1 cobalamin biosynthesis protein CbiM [Clostridium sp. 7_2_43FAA]MDB1939625.1 energy-coupling factor ABC transporter permease [Clostridium tertium]MDB1955013.1 energy-coupling factor ABC transporter permease [Clostridium tertium]MDB1958403.1 energy-coupling factor ABC transporter permease [Clostridium tertium]MDB1962620.1 energy-coupling factor ABC transporter permease [Clostridium tertium]